VIKCETAKEVAIPLALRRAKQRQPKEDEINAIEYTERQEKEGAEWARQMDEMAWEECWWGYEDECDVDAVGMGKGNPITRCHRCGGIGHMARECASPWDMLGKGKSAQKGGNPGKGGMYWGGAAGKGSKGGREATVKVEEDPKAKGMDTKASVSTVASRGTREANLDAGWRRAHSPWT